MKKKKKGKYYEWEKGVTIYLSFLGEITELFNGSLLCLLPSTYHALFYSYQPYGQRAPRLFGT